MWVRLLNNGQWEHGAALRLPNAIAVTLVKKRAAVPVVPPVSRQILQPEEVRHAHDATDSSH